MILRVDGVDLLPYLQSADYTVKREDLDGPNAGRTLDGRMHRDFLGGKRKIETKLRPLTPSEWQHLEHSILRNKPWHQVTFDDFGVTTTVKMYHSSFNGTISEIANRRIGATLNFIEE